MGGQMLGAFAAGLSSTLQQAQQRKTEQEYKKALVEQSKLQTKMLENKLALAGQEQAMWRAVASEAGVSLPPIQQQAPIQEAPAPVQKQGLLQKMFGGGQPPAPLAPAPVQQASAPQPITDTIAKGQMGANPLAKDILYKKFFDLDPKTREESHVARSAIIAGLNGEPLQTLWDKTGKIIKQYPAVTEYKTMPIEGQAGEGYVLHYPAHQPPNGPIMTRPSPLTQLAPPSEAENKELRQQEADLRAIQGVKDFAKDPKNKDAFGYMPQVVHNAYQDPYSAQGAIKRKALGVIGYGPPSGAVTKFQAKVEDLNSAIRNQLYGGNLMQQEAERFQRQAVAATTPEQLIAVAELLEEKIKSKSQGIREKMYRPPVQRGNPPSLNLNQQQSPEKVWEENGQKYRINPQTGKKQVWRP